MRRVWCCLWFRSGLTLHACSPLPGHIHEWRLLMHWLQPIDCTVNAPASVHSLWSSTKFLDRLRLTILSKLQSSLLIVNYFLAHFSLSVNFSCGCFDTALCQQPALPALTLCGLPSLWKGLLPIIVIRAIVKTVSRICEIFTRWQEILKISTVF